MSKGFSVIEIVVAASIFTLSMTSILGAFVYYNRVYLDYGPKNRAISLAEEGLEAARNIGEASLSDLTDGQFGLSTSTNKWSLSGTQDRYENFTRQINITTLSVNTKQVVSTVTWPLRFFGVGEVSLTTYLTNWRAVSADMASGLVVDTSSVSLDPGNQGLVVGITITNAGSADIAIDQITVSWTGGSKGNNIRDISLDATEVWTGNGKSGDLLDIANFTLTPSHGPYPVTSLGFKKDLPGATVSIIFTMADGSTKTVSGLTF